jgi:hypothetical protein
VLTGSIEGVSFHNAECRFCVLRIKAQSHRDLVTMVGSTTESSDGSAQFGGAVPGTSRSSQACMTCHCFCHHQRPNCIPLINHWDWGPELPSAVVRSPAISAFLQLRNQLLPPENGFV